MKDIQVTSFSVPASAFDPVVDVKQLRLGNWLQSFIIFNDGMGTISKKCISPFRVDLKTMEMLSDSQGKLFATMEPIPLTPEILEKAAFVDYAKNGWGMRLYLSSVDELFWGIQEKKVVYQTRGSGFSRDLNTKYVHQLQNLYFALTGEELIIEL